MLYWIWFIVLTALGWIFAHRAWTTQNDESNADFLCFSCMLLAVSTSWEGIGSKAFVWLREAVPNAGSDIHALTVLVILVLTGIAWVAHPFFTMMMFANSTGNVSRFDLKFWRRPIDQERKQ